MGLIIDNFAGGGGASTGIEAALGRPVDVAINHDLQAIRMHAANHPHTRHLLNNIWQVDPVDATGGQPVDFAWFSPDCKHFSKAKGGKPREKSIRDLAWVVVHWVQRLQEHARRSGDPHWRQIIKVIAIENVEEFRTWGPLCEAGFPIKDRAGETFELWQAALRKLGGKIELRELRACDYGAPTIRKRLFIVIRFDGLPIVWPQPSHGKPGSPEVVAGARLPWRTAAEIIDWSIACPSIFTRQKPLAEKTLRRIAHGIMKFVVNNPQPFIVGTAFKNTRASRAFDIADPLRTLTAQPEYGVVVPHITKFRNGAIGHAIDEPLATVTANSFIKRPGGSAPLGLVEAAVAPFVSHAQQGGRNRSAQDPLHTVTASDGDHNTVVGAHLVHVGNGERAGQAPRAMDVQRPLGTVVASGTKQHLVAALMQKFASGNLPTGADEPIQTVEDHAKHAVVCAHIEQANGGPKDISMAGRAADVPLSTVTASGSQQRLIQTTLVAADALPPEQLARAVHTAAFLIKYYGNESDGHGLADPLGTVTVADRFAVITVLIEAETYILVDIGMRMLAPRELFNAQSFPADYIIDRDADGKPITKTAQVAKCGNSVCPVLAEAIARATAPGAAATQAEAA